MLYVNRTATDAGLSNCNGGAGPPFRLGIVSSASCDLRVGGSDSRYDTLEYAAGFLDFTPTGDINDSANVVDQLALLLVASKLSKPSQELIQRVFESILDEDPTAAKVAQEVAQLLIMSTPEYSTTTNLVAPNHIERQPTPPDAIKPNTDYKALVFINLFGGMDSLNMLTPHPNGCQALYDEYVVTRGDNLALNYDSDDTKSEILEIPIGSDPSTQPSQPCNSFGVNSHLNELQQMYINGDATFFANIGTLSKPANAQNYRGETKVRLFSHFDMKEESMKVDGNGASDTGIMGRIADVMGKDLAVGQVTLDKTLQILFGDPAVGRKVDVVSSKKEGVDQFYRVSTELPGVSCPHCH